MTNSVTPASLGLHANPSAFDTVGGGAGIAQPLRLGSGVNCAVTTHNAFVPSGQSGEAAGGEGNLITYPEVLEISWNCRNSSSAQAAFRGVNTQGVLVGGIADRASVLDDSNNAASGFAGNRVFAVAWQRGPLIGTVELAGPLSDTSLNATLAERLAKGAAGSS